MQIFVRDYYSTFVLDVEPSDTICVLRRLICAKKQIPPDFQLLQYAGKILGLVSGNTLADDDTRTLESYGIAEEATLTLLCRTPNKRQFVPDEESYSSKQKRRALSNAIAPHTRIVERLTSERDEARAAFFRTRKALDETRAADYEALLARNQARVALGETRTALSRTRTALGETRTALDETRTARDEALAARDEARAALDEARTALAAPRCSGIAAGSVVNMSDTALEQLHEALLSAQAVLAREQQRRLDAERDKHLCVVCLDRPKTFMSRACNHLALCEACIPDGASPCPVCRVATSQWDRVYA